MVAPFAAARDRAVAAVDARLAEPVQIFFLKEGAADPERANLVVSGVLRVGGGQNTNLPGGQAKSWRTRLVAGRAELHIDPRAYAGSPIRRGDKVRALDRAGQPFFEVLHVDDRGHTRLVLELGEA